MQSPKKTFIAMAGNIGAGKTTAARLISREFGFELFDEPVIDNRFLRDYTRIWRAGRSPCNSNF